MRSGYDEAWLARHNARMERDGGRTPVGETVLAHHASLCQMDHPALDTPSPWLRLELPYPLSGNHLYTVANGRKVLSASGRDYATAVGVAFVAQRPKPWVPLAGHLQLVLGFFPPDHRRRDIDNPVKVILDSLTTAGAWLDDSQIDDYRPLRGAVQVDTPPYVLVLLRCVSPRHSLEVLMHL